MSGQTLLPRLMSLPSVLNDRLACGEDDRLWGKTFFEKSLGFSGLKMWFCDWEKVVSGNILFRFPRPIFFKLSTSWF